MNRTENRNRNFERTDRLIREALLQITRRKQIDKITVKDITEEADINRTTFYLHYDTVDQLIHTVEDEVIDKIGEGLEQLESSHYVLGEHPIHTDLFRIFSENEVILMQLLGPHGDITFLNRFVNAISQRNYSSWRDTALKVNRRLPPDMEDYAYYICCGMCGMVYSHITRKKTIKGKEEEFGKFAGAVTNWVHENFVVRYPDVDKTI